MVEEGWEEGRGRKKGGGYLDYDLMPSPAGCLSSGSGASLSGLSGLSGGGGVGEGEGGWGVRGDARGEGGERKERDIGSESEI